MATLHPSNPFYDPWCRTPHNTPSTNNPSPSATTPSQPSHTQNPAAQPTFQPPAPTTIRTRSIGGPFSAGIIFEHDPSLSPPNDDEIIVATVRITNTFRRASIEGSEDLPNRPPRRNFLRRVTTRFSPSADEQKYTVVKMPRKDYKKYFIRDREGKYAGSEPEREWTREDLMERFARFQNMPLRSIPGASEFGEGDALGSSSSNEKCEDEKLEVKPEEEEVVRNDSVMGGSLL